jgi:Kdo2-lipid IVA lauroyltransferase/acyltransferase
MVKYRSELYKKFEYMLVRGLFFIVKISPFKLSGWLGKKLGALSFKIIKSRRNLTIENIREARERGFIPLNVDDYDTAQKVWEHLCIMAVEFAYYYSRSHKRIRKDVALEGTENLKQILERNQGVILVTTHVGNWELMGMALALAGFEVNSIVQAQSNTMWDQYINDCRLSMGMKVIRKKGFLRPIVNAFKRNEIVSFFIDQNAGRNGILLDVFGREARVPRGAAEFALKLDIPVVFAYIIREAAHRHRLVISEEIQLKRSGDYPTDLRENTALFMGLVQTVICRYPEQWLWMHKFWKTAIKV